jgi:hypothetical protein
MITKTNYDNYSKYGVYIFIHVSIRKNTSRQIQQSRTHNILCHRQEILNIMTYNWLSPDIVANFQRKQ